MIALVVGMILVTPVLACPPNKPMDPKVEKEIVESISKKVVLPTNYTIVEDDRTHGYFLTSAPSNESIEIINISSNYEILETWNGDISAVPGGYKASFVSDKGNKVSATMIGDPTSNSAKVTVYDSSSGKVITDSIDCYGVCLGGCSMLVGDGCSPGCASLCAWLIESGIGVVACYAVCMVACGGGTVYGCDKICDALC